MLGGFFVADCISKNYENIKVSSLEEIPEKTTIKDNISYTKHTILTIATMDWLMHHRHSSARLLNLFKKYFNSSSDKSSSIFGADYAAWLSRTRLSYRYDYDASCAVWGSVIGFCTYNMRELKRLIKRIVKISNDSKESLKACEISAIVVYMSRKKTPKEKILKYLQKNYDYVPCENLTEYIKNFKLYTNAKYNITASLHCFFHSNSFIETITNSLKFNFNRNLISCISTTMAEAYFGLHKPLSYFCRSYLPKEYLEILIRFDDYIDLMKNQKDSYNLSNKIKK